MIQAFETQANDGRDLEQQADAAVIMAMICADSLCGKKPEEALDWLLLASSLSNELSKSSLYRVSKALGLCERNKSKIMGYLIESAKEGHAIAVEDLLEADMESGVEIVKELERDMHCKFQLIFFPVKSLT
jgi:hypothetical protein